jgi:hypothetical protein
MTDPSGYAKTLALPAGFDAPRLLRYEDVAERFEGEAAARHPDLVISPALTRWRCLSLLAEFSHRLFGGVVSTRPQADEVVIALGVTAEELGGSQQAVASPGSHTEPPASVSFTGRPLSSCS